MRRLPPWLVLSLAVLSVLLIWVGWDERHHAGYLPFVMGILWGLFTLVSAKGVLADEKH